MAITPLIENQSAGVSTWFNDVASAIDELGTGCVVRRSQDGVAGVPANGDWVIGWQALDLDTSNIGMWDPNDQYAVTIRVAGVYTLLTQLRFAEYNNAGVRAGRIMINGVNPASDTVASDIKPWSIDGEGVTLSITTTVRCEVGTRVYVGFRHTASAPLTCLQTSFGGTYLAVARNGAY